MAISSIYERRPEPDFAGRLKRPEMRGPAYSTADPGMVVQPYADPGNALPNIDKPNLVQPEQQGMVQQDIWRVGGQNALMQPGMLDVYQAQQRNALAQALRLIGDTSAPGADPSLDGWFNDNAPLLTAKQLADLIEQEQTHRRIPQSPSDPRSLPLSPASPADAFVHRPLMGVSPYDPNEMKPGGAGRLINELLLGPLRDYRT
jgi:hypothetical protein